MLPDNILNWDSFSLDFRDETSFISMNFADDVQVDMEIGLDNRYRFTSTDVPDLGMLPARGRLAMRGFWQDENTFIINFQVVSGSEDVWLDMTFGDDGVDIQMVETVSQITVKFPGSVME